MCGSMVDIQSPTAEIRRGKKIEETTGQKYNGLSYYTGLPQLGAKDVLQNKVHTGTERAEKCRILSRVICTFVLDLQTRLCKGPITFSVCIWCKSVQRFPRCHTQRKNHKLMAPKTAFCRSLRVVMTDLCTFLFSV